ncbi:MAG TPA: hypothetical protein PL117_18920, partial [Accumulibacter sp.]|uniref:hypothetical protein n=1 Tax=Accumulibacter sp. TaxID=2053492 RepID=UPI002BD2CED0
QSQARHGDSRGSSLEWRDVETGAASRKIKRLGAAGGPTIISCRRRNLKMKRYILGSTASAACAASVPLPTTAPW